MTWIDSHCHFDFEVFNGLRRQEYRRAKILGMAAMVMPGVSPTQWLTLQTLCQEYQNCYWALGVHPWWIDGLTAEVTGALCHNMDLLAARGLKDKHCVAIGECGLDGKINTPMAFQREIFTEHCRLAEQYKKPMIIHASKAQNDVLQILNAFSLTAGGVIHGFSGSLQQAEQFWQKGFYLGVGGTITYERAQKTRNAVTRLPLEALLLETDAPDMPLAGMQGRINRPSYLPEVAACLAELRAVPISEIYQQTKDNTRRLFNLP